MSLFSFNQTYYGFTLNAVEFLPDLDANLYTFTHNTSGAILYYMDKDDVNKVFGVGFKTIPEDSTGVFHILEHSVLCGSKKYPVKEPFVNLLKTSMASFINAMTFPDKTIFPLASCNEKDFENLIDVYLNAVFYPRFYETDEMFLQEGWHYELFDKNAEPTYKGVVFNEMTGAMSSVNEVVRQEVSAGLFPDSPYRFNSGGEPSAIPDLTYEQFIAMHQKYYSPDNSTLFLYGSMDIMHILSFLHGEYLSKLTPSGEVHTVPVQPPVITDITCSYELSPAESEEGNAYFARGYVVGDFSETEKNFAISVLLGAIMADNQSPLKKKLLDASLGANVSVEYIEDVKQQFVTFQLDKANADRKDEFIRVLTEGLTELCEKGIDKDLLRASFNRVEFSLREMNTGSLPKGIIYYINLLSATLYGGKCESLNYSTILDSLRAKLETDYFENLIRTVFLESNHYTTVTCLPSKTLGEEKAAAASKKLSEYKASLSDEELDALIEKNKKLVAYQSAEDSPEATATIPTLSLSDLADAPKPILTEVTDGIVYHEIDTNGIIYANYYFDLDCVPTEDLSYLTVLTSLLGSTGTKSHTAAELSNELRLYTGAVETRTESFSKSVDSCDLKLRFGFSVLPVYLKKAVALTSEILNETVLDKDILYRKLMQAQAVLRQSFVEAGHTYAITRASSYFTAGGFYAERLTGITFYQFICDLLTDFDEKYPVIEEKLYGLMRKIFVKGNLTATLTAQRKHLEAFKNAPISLREGTSPATVRVIEYGNKNEAFVIPSGVSYNVKMANVNELGYAYSGKMPILAKLLHFDYLWTAIRVKGGAYGTGFSVSRNGIAFFHSFRDPNVAESFAAYDDAAKMLASFNLDDATVSNYIVSTIAMRENPTSPKNQGKNADEEYFIGITHEDTLRIRNEILSTTKEDLYQMVTMLERIAENGAVCSFGNAEKIRSHDGFASVIEL